MWHKSNGETQRKNTARLTTSFWTATSFCAGFGTQLPPRGLGLLGSRVRAGTGLLGDSVRASMSEKKVSDANGLSAAGACPVILFWA